MTAFGGTFGTPALDGVEGSDENGERGPTLGLDLEGGVVRIQRARTVPPEPVAEDEPEGVHGDP